MINWYKKQRITIRAAIIGGMFAIAAAAINVAFDLLKPTPIVIVPILTESSPDSTPTITPKITAIAPSPVVIQPPYQNDLDICHGFVVIPFLRKVILTFYKPDEDIIVRVTYYDVYKVSHSLENGIAYGNFDLAEYVSSGPNESYVINNPYPGTWIIESDDCSGLEPYYEPTVTFSGDMLKLETQDGASDNSYYIKYFAVVNDEYRLRPPENPDFDFQVIAKVINPDRTITSYEMKWEKGDELFISKDLIDFSQHGEYKVDIVIYLPNCDIESGLKFGYIPATCQGLKEYHRYTESFSFR